MTDSLQHIVAECAKGRRDAQERLYRMFSAKMFGVCLRYCHDYDAAKDILQDGFIRVFDKIHQFGNRGSFEGWMRRIIVNTALERYRKNITMVSLDVVQDVVDEDGYGEDDSGLSMNEMLGLVQELPDRYRLVFNLYVFEDMSHKDIAQELGISEGTSKSDLSRARMILKKKLIQTRQQMANENG
ncbi:MAG: RNA polymerase sigma factor [Bacteroidota bacterium]|nr:RNA polymerase sigma factor [Bacteroidota bacterium]